METKSKKNRALRSGALAVILMLAITALTARAFAKYILSASNLDSARVAIFDAEHNIASFRLFDTISYEEDGITPDPDVLGNGTDNLIAPGTGGNFTLQLMNASEVTVEYVLDLHLTEATIASFSSLGIGIPIEFSVDGGSTWANLESLPGNNAPAIMPAGGQSIPVQWRWPFDRGMDYEDSSLGIAARAAAQTIEVEVLFNMVQID